MNNRKQNTEKDTGKDYAVCKKCGNYFLIGLPFNPICHKCRD